MTLLFAVLLILLTSSSPVSAESTIEEVDGDIVVNSHTIILNGTLVTLGDVVFQSNIVANNGTVDLAAILSQVQVLKQAARGKDLSALPAEMNKIIHTLACSLSPCSNGGSCTDVSMGLDDISKGYECVCPSNYFGEACHFGPISYFAWSDSLDSDAILAVNSMKSVVYMAGYMTESQLLLLAAMNSTSNQALFDVTSSDFTAAFSPAMAIDSSNSVCYVIVVPPPSYWCDTTVYAFDMSETGALIYDTQWQTVTPMSGGALTVNVEDQTGYFAAAGPQSGMLLLAFNLSTGEVLFNNSWVVSQDVELDNEGSAFIEPSAMVFDGGRKLLYVGGTISRVSKDLFFSAFDTLTGALIYTKQWGTTSVDYLYSLALDTDHSTVYLLGSYGAVYNNVSGSFLAALNLSNDAAFIYNKGADKSNSVKELAIDANSSRAYAAGSNLLIIYDLLTGLQLKDIRMDNGDENNITSLCTDPETSDLFVAGQTSYSGFLWNIASEVIISYIIV